MMRVKIPKARYAGGPTEFDLDEMVEHITASCSCTPVGIQSTDEIIENMRNMLARVIEVVVLDHTEEDLEYILGLGTEVKIA